MSYKHLLVHLDTSRRAPERLDLAATLAKRFGARLTGLFRLRRRRTRAKEAPAASMQEPKEPGEQL